MTAARKLEAKVPRLDAVFYPLDAPRLFRGKSLQEITFEIGMLGQYGLDINDPKSSHVLQSLPGRTFCAAAHLHRVCRVQEDRAGNGYRGGSGRRVRDGGEAGVRDGLSRI